MRTRRKRRSSPRGNGIRIANERRLPFAFVLALIAGFFSYKVVETPLLGLSRQVA